MLDREERREIAEGLLDAPVGAVAVFTKSGVILFDDRVSAPGERAMRAVMRLWRRVLSRRMPRERPPIWVNFTKQQVVRLEIE